MVESTILFMWIYGHQLGMVTYSQGVQDRQVCETTGKDLDKKYKNRVGWVCITPA